MDPNLYSVSEDLLKAVNAANRDIAEKVNQNIQLEGMGTTVSAVFNRGGLCHWIHVGDSRIYLVRDRRLKQITEDQSVPGLLLATDGLHSALPEEVMAEILYSTPDLEEKLRTLVKAALNANSQDDISVIGAQI